MFAIDINTFGLICYIALGMVGHNTKLSDVLCAMHAAVSKVWKEQTMIEQQQENE